VIAESMNCSQFGSHTEKQIAIVMSVTVPPTNPPFP
jgi:hypothetical protein